MSRKKVEQFEAGSGRGGWNGNSVGKREGGNVGDEGRGPRRIERESTRPKSRLGYLDQSPGLK